MLITAPWRHISRWGVVNRLCGRISFGSNDDINVELRNCKEEGKNVILVIRGRGNQTSDVCSDGLE